MPAEDNRVPGFYSFFLTRIFVVILLLAALINRETDLALLCLAVLAVVGLARFWSRLSRAGVDFEVGSDRRRVFPGESVTLTLAARNRRFLPVWVQAAAPMPQTMESEEELPNLNAALLWYESALFRWTLTAARRGVYRIEPRHITAGDLLGMFPRAKPPAAGVELIVYPRLIPVQALELPQLELFGAPGARSPVLDPVYIMGTRDYQPGRPSRFIHWRASARHQRWQEKVFEPSAQTKVLLTLDAAGFAEAREAARTLEEPGQALACAERAVAGFEKALEVMASLAVDFDRRGIQTAVMSNCVLRGERTEQAVVTGVSGQPDQLLEYLARLKMEASGPLVSGLAAHADLVRGRSVIHCSHEFGGAARTAGAFFESRHQPVVFLVARPGEGAAEGTRLHRLSEIAGEAAL